MFGIVLGLQGLVGEWRARNKTGDEMATGHRQGFIGIENFKGKATLGGGKDTTSFVEGNSFKGV